MSEIDDLRTQIRDNDVQILKLLAKRQELALEIGRLKKQQGIPLKNWDVEKTVMTNALAEGARLGLSENLVSGAMRSVIFESCIKQEELHYSAFEGSLEKILVVGGLGGMGAWFARFFQNQGHRVSVFDVNGQSDEFESFDNLGAALETCTMVCIAVSLDAVPHVIDSIAAHRFKGVVFDIASIKGHVVEAIDRARAEGLSMASCHPMFGPGTRTLSDKVVCLCETGDSNATSRVEALFKDTAATLISLNFEEHDKTISSVLCLSHVINIILSRILCQGDLSIEQLQQIASPTFSSQMVTLTSVITENSSLYYAIQSHNPFKEELYRAIDAAVEEVTSTVLTSDEGTFKQIMAEGQSWLRAQ